MWLQVLKDRKIIDAEECALYNPFSNNKSVICTENFLGQGTRDVCKYYLLLENHVIFFPIQNFKFRV